MDMGAGRLIVSVLVLLGMVAAGVMARPALARIEQAPASRVTLDLPQGFKPSALFTGFISDQLGASFVVVELPAAAYDQLAKGLNAEALAAKGVLKARAAKLSRPEPYLYVQAEQPSAEGMFAKYFLLFRGRDTAALITANIRKATLDQGEIKDADIERILASAEIAAHPAPARDVFALDYLGPFKAAGTMLGTTRSFTLDGGFEPAAKGAFRPVVIVSPSLDRRPVPVREAYAETLLEGLAGLSGAKIEERRQIKLAGLDTIEIIATANDRDGGGPIVVYQALLLPPGGGYYRIVGQFPQSARDQMLAEVRKIAAGFRPLE